MENWKYLLIISPTPCLVLSVVGSPRILSLRRRFTCRNLETTTQGAMFTSTETSLD